RARSFEFDRRRCERPGPPHPAPRLRLPLGGLAHRDGPPVLRGAADLAAHGKVRRRTYVRYVKDLLVVESGDPTRSVERDLHAGGSATRPYGHELHRVLTALRLA